MSARHTLSKRIPWIFFDLDDTLWDFSNNSLESLRHLYENIGEFKGFDSFKEFIDIYHLHNSELWSAYSKGEIDTDTLKIERWRRKFNEKLPYSVELSRIKEIDREYLSFLSAIPREMEGVTEMLESLSHRSIIGVISNGFSDTQYRKLKFSGLQKYVTRIIVSEEIGISKPDPAIFQYAVRETGATGIQLMVGDNFSTDILGAVKSGWHAIWLNLNNKEVPITSEDFEKEGLDSSLLFDCVSNILDVKNSIERFLSRFW